MAGAWQDRHKLQHNQYLATPGLGEPEPGLPTRVQRLPISIRDCSAARQRRTARGRGSDFHGFGVGRSEGVGSVWELRQSIRDRAMWGRSTLDRGVIPWFVLGGIDVRGKPA